MNLQRLSTGYWLAKWSSEEWAQWPVGRLPKREEFFHADFTYSEARVAEIATALAAASREDQARHEG